MSYFIPQALWTDEEKDIFLQYYQAYGRDWSKFAAEKLPEKTPAQIRNFFQNQKHRLSLSLPRSRPRLRQAMNGLPFRDDHPVLSDEEEDDLDPDDGDDEDGDDDDDIDDIAMNVDDEDDHENVLNQEEFGGSADPSSIVQDYEIDIDQGGDTNNDQTYVETISCQSTTMEIDELDMNHSFIPPPTCDEKLVPIVGVGETEDVSSSPFPAAVSAPILHEDSSIADEKLSPSRRTKDDPSYTSPTNATSSVTSEDISNLEMH